MGNDQQRARNEEDIGVYYIAEQEKCMNTRKIFNWLGFRSPQRLEKKQREYTNDVILYILLNVRRHEDDIELVSKTLHDYPRARGAKIIYILAIVIYDDANKHKGDCFIPMKTTIDTITLLEIHCTRNYQIHNCKGNMNNKNYIQRFNLARSMFHRCRIYIFIIIKHCFNETQATRCSMKKPYGKKAKYFFLLVIVLIIVVFLIIYFFLRWKCELHQLCP